jgi:hypothetical protein
MTYLPIPRRRAPEWVRALASPSLHSLAGRLQRDFRLEGLSRGQEWLLDACISELEHRHRHPETWTRCDCDLCIEPFPVENICARDIEDAIADLYES